MSLEAGYGYWMGRLGRPWESTTTKGGRVLWKTGLAYQPKKEDETVWLNLTVWDDKDNGNTDGPAIADATGKGDLVIARGLMKWNDYTNAEGEDKGSWDVGVWDLGKVVKAPFVGKPEKVTAGRREAEAKVEYDDEEPF